MKHKIYLAIIAFMVFNLIFLAVFFNNKIESTKVSIPILGERDVNKVTGDTLYYKIPDFNFTNQLNNQIDVSFLKGKVTIAEFFFTSCPTICPKMTYNLKQVQDHFKTENRINILSFSIDPQNDSPERLYSYSQQHGIDNNKWQLLTGDRDTILELAKSFKVRAFDDSSKEEKSIIHDGSFVLLDQHKRIRGYYNGLDSKDIRRLINDVKILISNEM